MFSFTITITITFYVIAIKVTIIIILRSSHLLLINAVIIIIPNILLILGVLINLFILVVHLLGYISIVVDVLLELLKYLVVEEPLLEVVVVLDLLNGLALSYIIGIVAISVVVIRYRLIVNIVELVWLSITTAIITPNKKRLVRKDIVRDCLPVVLSL